MATLTIPNARNLLVLGRLLCSRRSLPEADASATVLEHYSVITSAPSIDWRHADAHHVAVPCWGRGGGHRPLQIVASPPKKNKLTGPQVVAMPPKFSRTLDTLWSIDSQKKLVNLMSPDIRFYG